MHSNVGGNDAHNYYGGFHCDEVFFGAGQCVSLQTSNKMVSDGKYMVYHPFFLQPPPLFANVWTMATTQEGMYVAQFKLA